MVSQLPDSDGEVDGPFKFLENHMQVAADSKVKIVEKQWNVLLPAYENCLCLFISRNLACTHSLCTAALSAHDDISLQKQQSVGSFGAWKGWCLGPLKDTFLRWLMQPPLLKLESFHSWNHPPLFVTVETACYEKVFWRDKFTFLVFIISIVARLLST